MRRLVIFSALAVALLTSSCNSSEAAPTILPPVKASRPPVSPSAVSSVPAVAGAATSAGAQAFASYFLDELGRAFEASDASSISRLSAVGCGGCDNLIAAVKAQASRGEHRLGGRYEVSQIAAPAVTGGDVVVLIDYRRGGSKTLGKDDSVIATAAPVAETQAQMRLVWIKDEWRVQGYRVLS